MTGGKVPLAGLRRYAEGGSTSELPSRELLALVEAVEAAYGHNPCPACGVFSIPPGLHLHSCHANRFDFSSAGSAADTQHR